MQKNDISIRKKANKINLNELRRSLHFSCAGTVSILLGTCTCCFPAASSELRVFAPEFKWPLPILSLHIHSFF